MLSKRFPGTNIEICKGYPIAVSLQIRGFLTESENPHTATVMYDRGRIHSDGCPLE